MRRRNKQPPVRARWPAASVMLKKSDSTSKSLYIIYSWKIAVAAVLLVLAAGVLLNNTSNYLPSTTVTKDAPFMEKTENQIVTQDQQEASTRPYPRYLMIIKSSRVGSTFVHQTIKNHYNPSILPQWEQDGKAARAHFERCGKLPPIELELWMASGCARHI